MRTFLILLGLSVASTHVCYAIQFDENIAARLKAILLKASADSDALDEQYKRGLPVICQELAKEVRDEGAVKFAEADDADKDYFDVWTAVSHTYEYKQDLELARKTDSDAQWEIFKKAILYSIVAELKKKGLDYPQQAPFPFKDWFLLSRNQELDPKANRTLVKAAFLLLLTPSQVQQDSKKGPSNEFTNKGCNPSQQALSVLKTIEEAADKLDLIARAKKEISERKYLTLATVDKDMTPSIAPVYSAFDDKFNFYWMSGIESQHSKNIRFSSKISTVLYDSTVPEGTGFGIYLSGEAFELGLNDLDEIRHGIEVTGARIDQPSLPTDKFLPPKQRRVYKFVPDQVWVNSFEEIQGEKVDNRMYITQDILSHNL